MLSLHYKINIIAKDVIACPTSEPQNMHIAKFIDIRHHKTNGKKGMSKIIIIESNLGRRILEDGIESSTSPEKNMDIVSIMHKNT